jgi:Dynein light intermediate chain (DLIC)
VNQIYISILHQVFPLSLVTDSQRLFRRHIKDLFSRLSDHTRLGHWILDGDSAHSHLLRFALTESNFTETTVLVSMS